jgi:protein SCO1/2
VNRLLAIGGVAVVALFAASGARAQAAPDMEILPPPPKEVGFDQHIGEPLPLDAVFKDETGKDVRLGDYFSDKPVVLSFAYDTCPMLCDLSVQGLASSFKGMNLSAGADFTVVTISFDPRDTPERARVKKDMAIARYGRDGAARGWSFLSGEASAIEKVTRAAGFRYTWDTASSQYAHPAGMIVATPQGTIARYLFGIEYASKDLRLSLVEASKGHVGNLVDQLILLCYHYDPKVGKYGPAAVGAMRAAGAFTCLSLGVLVVVLTRRERKGKGAPSGRGEGN